MQNWYSTPNIKLVKMYKTRASQVLSTSLTFFIDSVSCSDLKVVRSATGGATIAYALLMITCIVACIFGCMGTCCAPRVSKAKEKEF